MPPFSFPSQIIFLALDSASALSEFFVAVPCNGETGTLEEGFMSGTQVLLGY